MPCSSYETFLHAAGMVQTRTFRIDALDIATGAPLLSGGVLAAGPLSAAVVGGAATDQSGTRDRKGSSNTDSSQAAGASGGDSSEAEQQRFVVPVIDMANHSTLAAGANAELRLGAGSASGLRFALDAREP